MLNNKKKYIKILTFSILCIGFLWIGFVLRREVRFFIEIFTYKDNPVTVTELNNNDVYILGDSYVVYSNPARWTYYIYNSGYDFFCYGIPGGRSANLYGFLQTAITLHKPKYVIWCLGMNDGPDRFCLPQIAWKYHLKKVMKLCKENNITLILATVPTCPAVNNDYKNAYIRKSGYRYIDFDRAVSDGRGKWKNGFLSDNVHPTEAGAKALAEQFLKDFPEIKQY